MALPGPAPKPTFLRVLEGKPSKHPQNEVEPTPKKGIPKCPAHLSKLAKKEWRKISKQLNELGLLTEIDGEALALFCDAWARWVDASEKIEKTGMIIKLPKSQYPMLNPYMPILNKALDQMRMLLAEFGMTPASRTRVAVTPKGMGDEMEGLIR